MTGPLLQSVVFRNPVPAFRFMGPHTHQGSDGSRERTRAGAVPRLPRRLAWIFVGSLWALAVCVRGLDAVGLPRVQDAPVEMTKSTRAGVFTAAQAESGQAIYESTCLGGCHSLASHRGVAFRQRWDGHPVFELYQVINEEMPKDDPGSLTADQSLQLVAYMLKLNGLPAGSDRLPTDAGTLKKIKIELPPPGSDLHR
jgi:hypothetical protein